QAHRRARMSTPAVLDGLRREHPSGVDRARVQVRPVGGVAGGGELGDLRRAGHWWFSRVEGAARIRAYVLAHSNGRRGAGWPGPCPRLFAAPPPWTQYRLLSTLTSSARRTRARFHHDPE